MIFKNWCLRKINIRIFFKNKIFLKKFEKRMMFEMKKIFVYIII